MSDEALPPLKPEYGSREEWKRSDYDGKSVILRVADFVDLYDAAKFNDWCDADYYLQKIKKPKARSHDQDTSDRPSA